MSFNSQNLFIDLFLGLGGGGTPSPFQDDSQDLINLLEEKNTRLESDVKNLESEISQLKENLKKNVNYLLLF